MVDGVKGRALIKECQDDSVAVVNRSEEIVKYIKKSSFVRVSRSVRLFYRGKEGLRLKIGHKLFSGDTFKKFREE
jgi:hypothetical protein